MLHQKELSQTMDQINITQANKVFKGGSTTYFYSSIFFPKSVRRDVALLYSFVRIADNYVDSIPQNTTGFFAFRDEYYKSIATKEYTSDNSFINSFVDLSSRIGFDPLWAKAFLASMESDITKNRYQNFEELDTYIYGSAEVIGLYLAKLLKLPQESLVYAQKLGKAMQYINFIRDIYEDLGYNRIYIPITELTKYGIPLSSFNADDILNTYSKEFIHLIRAQIKLFEQWQKEAEAGFTFIPRRYLIPIKTASEMYKYTARRIADNPLIVFRKKIKPSKKRIFAQALFESITL